MDLALFDFDGTITTYGTYPRFVRFAVRPGRKVIGGIEASSIAQDQRRQGFATEVLPGAVRPAALERIAWHKARGDRVVVVSAALDLYLEPWGRAQGVDVICTRLEVSGQRCTGRYVRGDCCGNEKARRIRERYTLSEFETVYAYGDTEEDREMLAMADRQYFQWQEVSVQPSAMSGRGDGRVDHRCSAGREPLQGSAVTDGR